MKRIDLKIKEQHIFLLFVLINMIPIFVGKFFASMDGAAHLYNSNLINNLLFNDLNNVNSVFTLNQELVPNWSGHFLLSFFNSFLPAYIAEKIVLASYLIALPYSFRFLIQKVNPKNLILSYAIFPFAYSFLFILGFYNFSFALVFLFLGIGFWLKMQNLEPYKWYHFVILVLIFFSIYFSHIVVFSILMLCIGVQMIYTAKYDYFTKTMSLKASTVAFFKKSIIVFTLSSPFLYLWLQYFLNRPLGDHLDFKTQEELIGMISQLTVLIGYNVELELPHTQNIAYSILVLFALVLVFKIKRIIAIYRKDITLEDQSKPKLFSKNDYFLLVTIVLVCLLFIMPDSDGNAGYVSQRLALISVLFAIIWAASQYIPRGLGLIVIIFINYSGFQMNTYYKEVQSSLNEMAVDCELASAFIEEDGIVLVENFSNNWLVGHFANYLGIDKPIAVLENYEASVGYFPVVWNEENFPNLTLGSYTQEKLSHTGWKTNASNPNQTIEYIFILGNIENAPEEKKTELLQITTSDFVKVYETKHCQLFKLK